MIIMHPSGLREIHVDGRLLLLTEDEYQRALHRGRTVINNRPPVTKKQEEEDADA